MKIAFFVYSKLNNKSFTLKSEVLTNFNVTINEIEFRKKGYATFIKCSQLQLNNVQTYHKFRKLKIGCNKK